jgi:hypothetical protein
MTRKSELALLGRRFTHWEIWRGTSGLLYVRPADTPGQPVVSETLRKWPTRSGGPMPCESAEPYTDTAGGTGLTRLTQRE